MLEREIELTFSDNVSLETKDTVTNTVLSATSGRVSLRETINRGDRKSYSVWVDVPRAIKPHVQAMLENHIDQIGEVYIWFVCA